MMNGSLTNLAIVW